MVFIGHMHMKGFIGSMLVLLAVIMIGISLAMPWYRIDLKTSSSLMSYGGYIEYNLDHMKANFFGYEEEASYDEVHNENSSIVRTFRTTQIFVFLGIIGCVLGLIGVVMVLFEKINSKIGAVFILFAVILSLIAPIYLMVALPNAFKEDAGSGSESSTIYETVGKDFFGSKKEESLGVSSEVTWGGSTGWSLAIAAVIMCIVAFFLAITTKSVPAPISGPFPAKSGMYAQHKAQKTYQHERGVDSDGSQAQTVGPPRIFPPLVPPPPPPPPGIPAVPYKNTRFRCPQCGKILLVAVSKRPLQVTCSSCRLRGIIE